MIAQQELALVIGAPSSFAGNVRINGRVGFPGCTKIQWFVQLFIAVRILPSCVNKRSRSQMDKITTTIKRQWLRKIANRRKRAEMPRKQTIPGKTPVSGSPALLTSTD
jgi:hypothetical protein